MAYIKSDGIIHYDKITKPVVVQANYLAKWRDGHLVDDGISLYTGLMPWNWPSPGVSHTEIGFWLDGELWFFSSTSRKELGGKNGTRWIKGEDLLRNPERWVLQEKDLSYGEREGKVPLIGRRIDRANSLVGLGYDFQGVFTDFTIPWAIIMKKDLTTKQIKKLKKIYCSKAVHAVDTGLLCVFSPRRRFKWVKKKASFVTIPNTHRYLVEAA